MNTTAPSECKAWLDLGHHAESWRDVHLRELFASDPARPVQLAAEAPGMRYDFSRQRLGAMTLRLLANLAAQRAWKEGPLWNWTVMASRTVSLGLKKADRSTTA